MGERSGLQPLAGPTWFEDEASLLDVARGDAAHTPVIPGYSELRELKRGGQGVVFRAVQVSTSRPVAIKVLLAGGLATPTARRRFEREAELAAGLRHPNIVRIFDSGVTAEGSPFLVMEFVEGGPFLSSSEPPDRQTLRLRVGLMTKVVDAVGHAHQRGVLHRDLKPGNIRIDDCGEPRVLDFGLAKSLAASSLVVSASGQFVGSLPWASPEQLDDAASVDTRSDIYSLGVILHQLATGALPYDTSGPLHAALDTVRGTVPPGAASVNPAADGDLSTIIARCIAKDRARRYPSAAELGADLAAWLAGEPIRARRDSAWYTLRKRASRYRVAAWVGGMSALALAAAAMISVRWASIAERERDAAESALRRAETVTDVLIGMIVSPDPTRDGREVRVVEVLDEAASNVGRAFQDDAGSEVGVRLALAQSYTSLGQAEEGLREADLALRRAEAGPYPRPIDRVTADTTAVVALLELGRSTEALGRAERAHALASASLDQRSDGALEARAVLAACLENTGDRAGAIVHKQAVLDARRALLPAGHADIVTALNNLAVTHVSNGDLASATPLLREAHEALLAADGPEHPNAVVTAINLGTILKQQDRAAEALPILEAALAGATAVWGAEHLQTLSAAANRATTLTELERPAEAAAEFERILEIQRRTLDADHPRILITLSNLASARRASGDLAGAATLFQEAVEGATRTLGPGHVNTLMFRGNYAELLTQAGRPAESAPLLETIGADARRELGSDNWITGTLVHNLGKAYAEMGKGDQAIAAFAEAYTIFERSLGAAHHRARSAAGELTNLYEANGDASNADLWRARR